MLKSFLKEVDKVGKQVGKELDYAGKKINETVDKNYSSALLSLIKTGNVIQLISRSSGRTVQIVMGPTGLMMVDALGPLDPGAYNTLWTVVNEGNNQVRLHNYNNYLAVMNGVTCIIPVPPGTLPGQETKFQLSQIITQEFISLESLQFKSQHVGFNKLGQIKAANMTIKDVDGQYGVKLVSTAYPVVQPVGAHK